MSERRELVRARVSVQSPSSPCLLYRACCDNAWSLERPGSIPTDARCDLFPTRFSFWQNAHVRAIIRTRMIWISHIALVLLYASADIIDRHNATEGTEESVMPWKPASIGCCGELACWSSNPWLREIIRPDGCSREASRVISRMKQT